MKKALVVLAEGFEELEAVTCMDLLVRAGVEVVRAGITAGQLKHLDTPSSPRMQYLATL